MPIESSHRKLKSLVQFILRRPVLLSLLLALALYLVLFTTTLIWLLINGETTEQRRIALSPSVTVDIARPKTEANPDDALGTVPESWKNEDEKTAEQPAAMPEAKDAAPAIEQDQPPAADATAQPPVTTTDVPATGATWEKLARDFNHADARPRIGIIIVNLGLSNNTTRTAIGTLPADVTMAFQAVAPNVTDWIAQSHSAGHENLLMIPMEPYRYPQNDPGPQTLLTSLKESDNTRRLVWALDHSAETVGVMPSQGERFMTNERALAPVLDIIKQRGLIFVDTVPGDKSAAPALALLGRLPFLQGTVTLDATSSRQAIDQALHDLENQAKQNGQAIALVLPYPATFERLSAWIKTLPEKNLLLAPVSDLMMQKSKAAAVAPAAAPAATTATEQPVAATPTSASVATTTTEPATTPAPAPAATSPVIQTGSSPLLNMDSTQPVMKIDRSLTVGPAP